MKIIGRLNLKNKTSIILGTPWLDDDGQPKMVQVEGRKEKLAVILGGIRYVEESRVEIYDDERLDETRVKPAHYQIFGFIPFVDVNGTPSGMPHTEVDTIWATEVDSFRELWLRDDVLDAYDEIKNEGDDDEDEDDGNSTAKPIAGAQPAAASS